MPRLPFARYSRYVTATGMTALAMFSGACDRTPRSAGNDTAGAERTLPDDRAAAVARNPGWNEQDGSVLLVAGSVPGDAHLIAPNLLEADGASSRGDSGVRVTLVSRDGRLARAKIARVTPHDGAQCLSWPTGHVVDESGALPGTWNIGFSSDSVSAVPLDSVEAFSRSDSTRLATAIARMASALKDDTAGSFRGLPFVVREMRRFRPAPGVDAIVADVARLLATEANPREERLFLIAERSSGDLWNIAFVSRVSGPEDAVETTDALAVARLAGGRTVMIVALESASATRFALLERDADSRWTMRWKSAETDC